MRLLVAIAVGFAVATIAMIIPMVIWGIDDAGARAVIGGVHVVLWVAIGLVAHREWRRWEPKRIGSPPPNSG